MRVPALANHRNCKGEERGCCADTAKARSGFAGFASLLRREWRSSFLRLRLPPILCHHRTASAFGHIPLPSFTRRPLIRFIPPRRRRRAQRASVAGCGSFCFCTAVCSVIVPALLGPSSVSVCGSVTVSEREGLSSLPRTDPRVIRVAFHPFFPSHLSPSLLPLPSRVPVPFPLFSLHLFPCPSLSLPLRSPPWLRRSAFRRSGRIWPRMRLRTAVLVQRTAMICSIGWRP